MSKDDQPELIHVEPPEQPSSERQARPKSVAQAVCPNHIYTFRLTGLVRSGRHLYWRPHTVPSALGGRSRWCTASDAPLCAVAARAIPGQPQPDCPCGGKPE